jgi:hypothetical protein
MNTKARFQLRLRPETELAHLVQLTAGLLASGQCIPSTGPHVDNGDAEIPLARDAARELLEQLRWDIERRVDEFPDQYAGQADQMPIA